MKLIISFLFALFITTSFAAEKVGVIDHILALPNAGLSYDMLPCISKVEYDQLKELTGLDDTGLEGELCGDNSHKERVGKVLKFMMSELQSFFAYVEEDPENAFKEPVSYTFYEQMNCLNEDNYNIYKEALGFDDSSLQGSLCGDDSYKERLGKLLLLFRKGFTYFYNSLRYNIDKTLADPYRFFIDYILEDMEYEGSLLPSEEEAIKEGVTSYDKLPCLEEEDYPFLKSYLNIDDEELEGELCGDDSNRERFGKLLRYMKYLKVNLPHDWKGGASDALTNPLRYLKKGFSKVTFADQLGGAIASNRWGIINIYKLFFTQEPLDAIGTLIHESRHSDHFDPGHAKCTSGDRAQQRGACDEWFDSGDKAGAYAYNVSFYYGLAKYGLKSQVSDDDRSMLRTWATSLLSRRFNGVPDFLGLPFEVVYFLGDGGSLYYIHPILKEKVYVKLDLGDVGRLERIKFNRVRNDLFLFTDQGKLISNKGYGAPYRLYDEKIIPDNVDVREIERMTGKRYSETYYITEENEIRKKVFDIDQQFYVSERSLFQEPSEKLIRLYHANTDKRYVLAESGNLYEFKSDSNASGEEKGVRRVNKVKSTDNLFLASFQDPAGKGWQSIGGGVLFSDLFGINFEGQMYYGREDLIEEYPLNVSKVAEYLETTNFALILESGYGELRIRRYGEDKDLSFGLDSGASYESARITSMGFTRSFRASNRFKVDQNINQDFIDRCNIVKADIDPWLGKGMGINNKNELVFEGNRFLKCMKYSVHGSINVEDFRFRGTSVQEPGTFSDAALEILTEGEWKKIRPYDWRPFPIR